MHTMAKASLAPHLRSGVREPVQLLESDPFSRGRLSLKIDKCLCKTYGLAMRD